MTPYVESTIPSGPLCARCGSGGRAAGRVYGLLAILLFQANDEEHYGALTNAEEEAR